MEGNRMAGGMMPGMLGLEMPLNQPHHRHRHQTPPPMPQQQHLLLFAAQPTQNQQAHHKDSEHNAGVTSKLVYPFGSGAKVKPAPSSEEEPSAFGADEYSAGGGGAIDKVKQPQQQGGVAVSSSVSPTPSLWQRMKWTDTMVRLLIMVVYCVGDDGGPDGGGAHQSNKSVKKGSSAAAGAPGAAPCAGLQQQQQQQKKGKWKSVSRAMMEKGYYVSPQQCEDKFNDLNKRYKRVNDIVGRGTACRVVENHALLDTMDNLSPKAKEEVRKLLNSKHLFFREMCAYHRSCATAANTNSAGGAGGEPATAPTLQMQTDHLSCDQTLAAPSDPSQLQQQQCFHPSDISSVAAFSTRVEDVGTALKMMRSTGHRMGGGEEDGVAADEEDDENEEEDEDEDDEEDDYGDDEDDVHDDEEHISGRRMGLCAGGGSYHERRHVGGDDEAEDTKELLQAKGVKRQRRTPMSSPLPSSSQPQEQQQLRSELAALTGTPEQQRQWLRWRELELEERRVSYGRRALELEKQRFKWLRFSGNKEREMERAKRVNDRLSLENDLMLLLLRQKEMDLLPQSGSGGGAAVEHLLHNSSTSPHAPSASAS